MITGQPRGISPARILIIGEAFGEQEQLAGQPFVGQSGKELSNMLHDAGLLESEIRFTNVVNARPPQNDITRWFYSSKKKATEAGCDTYYYGKYPGTPIYQGLEELRAELAKTQPQLIIALGNTALWACTGQWGITNWRGSLMELDGPAGLNNKIKVVPTYHPAAILRQWSWRHIAVHDLRYAKENADRPLSPPDYRFITAPDFQIAYAVVSGLLRELEQHPKLLACDIETRQGQIACFGIAWSKEDAICIPLLSLERTEGYWPLEEETELVYLITRIITHPNARITWQNGLYDLQYIWDNWHTLANVTHDTMCMQHSAFPGLPKGLDFISSMYCRYRRFWKAEGKELAKKVTKEAERQNWVYNCKDCVNTFEAVGPLLNTLGFMNTLHIYEHTMSLYEPVLFMMLNGVRIDTHLRQIQTKLMEDAAEALDEWINFVVGRPFNVKSPPQMRQLFYNELRLPIIYKRDNKTKKSVATLEKNALEIIYKKHQLLQPLIDRILLRRKISTYLGTFLKAPLDRDKRIRCSYNIVGTETGRFSSSENAFGRGGNLENIPRPPEKHEAEETPIVRIPNIRAVFIPDPGMVIADFDLDRADAHIVAWEADDSTLKELFRRGVDIHSENAKVIGTSRQLAKTFVHGTNYGGSARTMADHCGITTAQAKRGQFLWFQAHPRIEAWHKQVMEQLMTTRQITTAFGRVRYYFDRINPQTRNEALAYLGQSPVADVINKGVRNVYVNLPWCQLLLQNHDSIVVQFPNDCIDERVEDIKEQLRVPIPYDDPLTIPVGCKLSATSWGALEEHNP